MPKDDKKPETPNSGGVVSDPAGGENMPPAGGGTSAERTATNPADATRDAVRGGAGATLDSDPLARSASGSAAVAESEAARGDDDPAAAIAAGNAQADAERAEVAEAEARQFRG